MGDLQASNTSYYSFNSVGSERHQEKRRMNWQRAYRAAGASIAALGIVFGAVFITFLLTFDLGSAFTFGGGTSGAELLWVFVPPVAVGAGSVLLSLALGARGQRALASAGSAAAVTVYISLSEIVPFNPLSEYEARFMAFLFLLVAVLSTLVATVRRPDISLSREMSILALSVATVFSGAVVFSTAPAGANLIAALIAWILLPAFTGLAILPRDNRQFSRDQ